MDTQWKLLILLFLILAAWGVVLGWSGEAIFFMDADDLMLSFLGWIALVAGIFLGMFMDWPWLGKAGAIAAAYFAYDAIRRAHLHNNGNWHQSVPVGIGKVLLSFIYTTTWLEALSPSGKTVAQRRESRVTAMILIGLLTLLISKLVNGEAVLARRSLKSPAIE